MRRCQPVSQGSPSRNHPKWSPHPAGLREIPTSRRFFASGGRWQGAPLPVSTAGASTPQRSSSAMRRARQHAILAGGRAWPASGRHRGLSCSNFRAEGTRHQRAGEGFHQCKLCPPGTPCPPPTHEHTHTHTQPSSELTASLNPVAAPPSERERGNRSFPPPSLSLSLSHTHTHMHTHTGAPGPLKEILKPPRAKDSPRATDKCNGSSTVSQWVTGEPRNLHFSAQGPGLSDPSRGLAARTRARLCSHLGS